MTVTANITDVMAGREAGIGFLRRPGTRRGDTIVLLHGIGSNAGSFEPLFGTLPEAFDAIAWHAPGYGGSRSVVASFPRPDDYADALLSFIDALGLERVTLVGHSLGCLFAGSFAARHPVRVSALALLSPALGYGVKAGETMPETVQGRIDELRALGARDFAAKRAARLVYQPEAKPAVLNAVREAMAAVDPVGYMQAARALGAGDLLADAASLSMNTLEVERFIEALPDGQGWRIGIGLIGLTAQAFFSEDLVQTAVPVLTRLTENLSLSSHLGALDGQEIVYLARRVPNHTFASNIRVGSRLPAHAANMGRIILAHLPPDKVDRLYAGTVLKAVTARTPTTLTQLHAQLDVDRKAGLAWSEGNFEAGISSVAAAIFDATGTPIAALNVIGHAADFAGGARHNQLAVEVAAAAREISQRLGWHASAAPRAASNGG